MILRPLLLFMAQQRGCPNRLALAIHSEVLSNVNIDNVICLHTASLWSSLLSLLAFLTFLETQRNSFPNLLLNSVIVWQPAQGVPCVSPQKLGSAPVGN